MTNLTSILLADLKVYADWKAAPLGALLQIRTVSDSSILVGMRCHMKIGGSPHPCFLVLEGKDSGRLLEEGILRDCAIDVSSLLEISVKDPNPVKYSQELYQARGILCESVIGSGRLFVRAALVNGTRFFVWIADPSGKESAGTATTNAPEDIFVLGETELTET